VNVAVEFVVHAVFNCVACSRWNVLAAPLIVKLSNIWLLVNTGWPNTMTGLGLVTTVTCLNGPQPNGNCVNNTGAAASTLVPGCVGVKVKLVEAVELVARSMACWTFVTTMFSTDQPR